MSGAFLGCLRFVFWVLGRFRNYEKHTSMEIQNAEWCPDSFREGQDSCNKAWHPSYLAGFCNNPVTSGAFPFGNMCPTP